MIFNFLSAIHSVSSWQKQFAGTTINIVCASRKNYWKLLGSYLEIAVQTLFRGLVYWALLQAWCPSRVCSFHLHRVVLTPTPAPSTQCLAAGPSRSTRRRPKSAPATNLAPRRSEARERDSLVPNRLQIPQMIFMGQFQLNAKM